jgi:hypothetical protein
MEREHAKEKQKLVKDKDAGAVYCPFSSDGRPSNMSQLAKGQLTKANQTKAKMESLARELQKVCQCANVLSPSILKLLGRTTNGSE